MRNNETGDYHCYTTNIPADRLAAEDISSTYALRWQVEILFNVMKTHGNLEYLPSEKAQVVECLVCSRPEIRFAKVFEKNCFGPSLILKVISVRITIGVSGIRKKTWVSGYELIWHQCSPLS